MRSEPDNPLHSITQREFETALRHHQAGELPQAERLYRRILDREPSHADALHSLGLIAYQVGQHEVAVDLIRRAIAVNPSVARFHNHLASALQELGRLNESHAHFERALALNPQSAQAMNNFGNLLRKKNLQAGAIEHYRRAIALAPDFAEVRLNLAAALLSAGRGDEAVAVAREALSINPGMPEAHNNLANALKAQGQLGLAADEARAALRLRPDYRDAHVTLGNIMSVLARHADAADAYSAASALGGDDPVLLHMLGVALMRAGRPADAMVPLQKATRLQPEYCDACISLGWVLLMQDRPLEAVAALEQAVRLNPSATDGLALLGSVFNRLRRFGDAIEVCGHALALDPSLSSARTDLGISFLCQGRVDDAIEQFRRAVREDPEFVPASLNLLHTPHYRWGEDPAMTFAAHREWAAAHADPLLSAAPAHDNDRSPQRRLRVGYVSGDFREHPVGRFMLPLLQAHDRSQVELFCYDCIPARMDDEVGAQLRANCDHWHTIFNVDDEVAAALVRLHGIDILVDLSGHTAFNRLLLFARKPAPIQVTYLGYPDTTGMRAMDYRITDAVADPPGLCDTLHTEELLRLPGGFLCYQLPDDAPPVSTLPAAGGGGVTFGSFNKLAKMTPGTMQLWARILQRVDRSRLVIKTPSLSDAATKALTRDMLIRNGLPTDCFELIGEQQSHHEHLASYDRIDIALDTFPYNGTTTTCEALAMGVPVVTLAGDVHTARVSASILARVGLEQWIATIETDYLQIAVDLAADLPALAGLRTELRARMLASSVCDAERLAREMEQAYRRVWRRWCER